jgi:hypothetical protein
MSYKFDDIIRWLLIIGGLAMMINAAMGNFTVKLEILKLLLGPTAARIAYFLIGALCFFFALRQEQK